MNDKHVKLLVIGAGPGGYVCAIKAAKLGVETLLVEESKPGGTCLNVGCIPSKAIIHAADEFYKTGSYAVENELGISVAQPTIDLEKTRAWKDEIVKRLNSGVEGLLKKAGAQTLYGKARFLDGKTVEVESLDGIVKIHADNIVIATGSTPIEVPSLPFSDYVMSSTDALALGKVPESLAVVGGGYIGLEIGTAFAKLGARVVVIEAADQILPQYDSALIAPVLKRLRKLNIEVMTNASAEGVSDGNLQVRLKDGSSRSLTADKVLVTVGRKPRTDCGIDELSLTMNGTYINIDEKCQTSMRGVYAIGDITGEPMLAHRAMAQGEVVAEIIAGENSVYDKNCIPAVCFTDPEIVTAGLSSQEALAQDIEVSIGHFPLQANGRAMTMERDDGFIRVVARKDNGVVLGIQAVGYQVSELSAAFSLAIEMGARAEDIAATVHAHPTVSEGFQEACMSVLGGGLHI